MAKIVFRIVCGEGSHTPQVDEQLRLIHAKDKKEAFQKAIHTGRHTQEVFMNDNGEQVEWQFVDVSELYSLNELPDGAEICSRVVELHESSGYIDLIRHKADRIRAELFSPEIEPV